MNKEKNVFLTNDITMEDWDYDNPDRYEYTKCKLNQKEYDKEGMNKEKFEEWADDNLSQEELYEMPMMNALRYYPSFIDFEEEDRYKVSGATTLLYDSELGAWAVAMSGGGMDLGPHLLDTFIEIGKGIPTELAEGIDLNYNAYIERKKHIENCKLLAKAFREKARVFVSNAQQLKA